MTRSDERRRATALVTGASEGIGEALARGLAAHGEDLVLVARRADRLERLAAELARAHGIRARALPCDLADPAAPGALVRALEAEAIEVDVLVNDAGFGLHGPFAEGDLAAELRMIQVNVTALTELTRRVLPGMLARRGGRVLNVASTAAFAPGPFMAVYYATKAYVLSLSEALAEELAGTGVSVTALCPGPTRTGFAAAAGVDGLKLLRQRRLVMDPEQVARRGLEGMWRGARLVVPGVLNRLLVGSARLAPRAWVARITGRVQGPGER